MKQALLDYALYNQWANQRFCDLFRAQPDSVLEQPLVSSFPSIRDTFKHLWAAEEVWMSRLKGISPATFPSDGFTGSNAELLDRLMAISGALVDFIGAQTEDFFHTPIEFSLLTANGVFRQLPKDMLHHLFNHQTSHRGQLITLGRQVGITAFPRTDYIMWVREQ